MSRRIPQPEDAPPQDARLRSEWRSGDADLIVDLHRRGYAGEGPAFADPFPDYVAETVREAGLDRPGHASRVWFAERGADAVGCAAMIDRGTRGQLRWVVLLPQARGLGLGKALFRAAMDHADAQGWPEVFLETTGGLAASMQLYLANGFTVTRHEPADLWGVPGYHIVMTRRLAP
jgi:GNAT superfamily N-acetyltransferase